MANDKHIHGRLRRNWLPIVGLVVIADAVGGVDRTLLKALVWHNVLNGWCACTRSFPQPLNHVARTAQASIFVHVSRAT